MRSHHHAKPEGTPSLEPLEPRLLLSGTITTSLAVGTLTVLGDGSPNDITVVKADNTVHITGNDGEDFLGLGDTIGNVTGPIKFRMGAGDDKVTIGEAGAAFWVGNDTLDPDFSTRLNPKDLSVDLGEGADVLTMIGVKARNVSILAGTGQNVITVRDNGGGDDPLESSTLICGGLSIVNGNEGCTITLAGTLVSGNCGITMGNGGGSVKVCEDTHEETGSPAPSFGSWIGGNLTILGGAGTDVVTLSTTAEDDEIDVEGNLVVTLLGAPDGFANKLVLAEAEVEGALVYTGGPGADQLIVSGDMGIDLSATINVMDGANVLQIGTDCELAVDRDLTYKGGAGTDNVSGGCVCVGRNATFHMGKGDNSIALQAGEEEEDLLWVGRNLAVSGGPGSDSLSFLGPGEDCTVGRSATFKLGDGPNSLTCDGLTGEFRVYGAFSYAGGGGADVFTWNNAGLCVGRDMTLALGAGDNTVSISANQSGGMNPCILVSGNLTCKTTTGNDSLTFAGPGEMAVTGNATFSLGGGTNSLVLTGDINNFEVWGDLAYAGGAGDDTFNVQDGDMVVKGNASFKAMDGTNRFTFCPAEDDFEVTGDLTYLGGSGADELRGYGWVEIDGDARFTLGAGNNLLTFTNATDEPIGVGGNLLVAGGAETDSVVFGDESWVDGDFVLKLGNGTNSLTMLGHEFSVGGKMTYNGGTGIDTLDLPGVYVLGVTQIKTGEGDDIVAWYEEASLSKLDLDTGGGADKAYLGDDAARSGGWRMATIKGVVNVKLGAGNDLLFVGFVTDGDPSILLAGEAVTFDGGAGINDALNYGKVLVVFKPLEPNWETINH